MSLVGAPMTGASESSECAARDGSVKSVQSKSLRITFPRVICGQRLPQSAQSFRTPSPSTLSLAQQAAYERAAQAAEEMNMVSASQADALRDPRIVALDIAKEIRSFGSASALELALAQRELAIIEEVGLMLADYEIECGQTHSGMFKKLSAIRERLMERK